MFVYEKKLQYPVRIQNPNPKLASIIISQYGGPNGELGASLRYLSQRYAMPYAELKGLLTDIAVEELGHLEMVGAIVHQLTRKLTPEQQRTDGFAQYFVDHTAGVYPQSAGGTPWSAATMQVLGDPIADLTEDMAADGTTTKEQPVKTKCRKPFINKVPIKTPLLIGVANGQVMRMCCLSVGFFVIIRLYCRYNGNKYQFAVRCFA